jgi:hypothetical protein
MENTPLHAQKVTILSRLIKESSLTLEEALLILKEEEEEIVSQPTFTPSTGTGTTWINPYLQPYGSGSITFNNGTTTWSSGSSTTTVSANSFFVAPDEAETDLNN